MADGSMTLFQSNAIMEGWWWGDVESGTQKVVESCREWWRAVDMEIVVKGDAGLWRVEKGWEVLKGCKAL